ncbi:MAG: histidine kinase [Acidobacteriia bacterium]|nr:histidine kinase [Terriglobia bacterium]
MNQPQRGKLKIFMGYAAGVGKTYQMLEEAHSLRRHGTDIVVGYFEPHGRQDTVAKAEGLEFVPRKKVEYRGNVFEEMDTDRILARHPQVCAVDEFPHTNVPGSSRTKRWEDVMVLLDAGIDVLTTMNIQHLESLNDQVQYITGVTVRETVPDWIIRNADEVVMVDLTPRALMHRLQRGVVYRPEQAERALQNFFREPTLVALRELALREAAHEVGQRLGSETETASRAGAPTSNKQHKVLIHITPDPKTAMVTRRAKRVSDFLGAECVAVLVQPSGDLTGLAEPARQALEKHLAFARNLRIEIHILKGTGTSVLVDFARQNGVTQIFVTRPRSRTWLRFGSHDPVQEIIDLAKDMQIVIVSDRDPSAREHRRAGSV